MIGSKEELVEQLEKLMADRDRLEANIQDNGAVLESNAMVGMDGPLIDEEGFPRNDIDVYEVRQARHNIICYQNDHKDLTNQIEELLHKLHGMAADEKELVERTDALDLRDEPITANGILDNNAANNEDGALANVIDDTPVNNDDSSSNTFEETNKAELNDHAESTNVVDDTTTTGPPLNDDGVPITSNEETPPTDMPPIVKVNLVSPNSPAEEAGLRSGDLIIEFGTVNAQNFRKDLNQIGDIVKHMQNQRINLKVKRNEKITDFILVPKSWGGRGLLGCNIVLLETNDYLSTEEN